jgi:hypothetical protein
LDTLFAKVRAEGAGRRNVRQDKADTLKGMLMPCQVKLLEDRARHIAVRSARRTGKSTGALFMAAIRCLERPGSTWVVIGLTRPSVKRIFWATLQSLNQSFELGIKFHHQDLTAKFANGSQVYFVGADNLGEIEKLRGGQYDGAIIDESKSFGPNLFKELIEDVLDPAMMDRSGQMYLIGTPGDDLAGPFYLATCEDPVVYDTADGKRQSNRVYGTTGEVPAIWSLHPWTLQDNQTAFTDRDGNRFTLWDKALEIKAIRGWGEDHPSWRREYLGHWVAGDAKRVYRYYSHHNWRQTGHGPHGLPSEPTHVWKRVIGFDFGTRDGTAMVVWAYSETLPGLYELYSDKRTAAPGDKMSVGKIADWYREVELEFGPFEAWQGDYAGLATMVMDTLADEYKVYIDKAEKKEKLDYIQLMNTDFDAGQIHILDNSPLAQELIENKWDPKTLEKDKRLEDRNTPNDVCDAALYAWRWCRHRQYKTARTGPAMGTSAWVNDAALAELAAAKLEAKNKASQDDYSRLDREWWAAGGMN